MERGSGGRGKWLLLAAALLLFSPLGGATGLRAGGLVPDSLEGEAKIDAYRGMTGAYFSASADPLVRDTLLGIYEDMHREALRIGHVRYQGAARANIVSVFYNNLLFDEVYRRAPLYLSELKDAGGWRHYFFIYGTLVRTCLADSKPGEAITHARRMYEEAAALADDEYVATALYTLSEVCREQFRYREAEDYLRQTVGVIGQMDDPLLPTLLRALADLADLLTGQDRLDEARDALAQLEQVNHRFDAHWNRTDAKNWSELWQLRAQLCIQAGDIDQAEAYCNRVDSLIDSPFSNMNVLRMRAEILNARGRYREALEMADRAIAPVEEYTSPLKARQILKMKILMNLGRGEEAYRLFEGVMHLTDSIRDVELAAQLDEIRTQYEVDRLEADRARKHLQLTWALVACALLGVIFAGYVAYSRRLHAKNLAIYRSLSHRAGDGGLSGLTPRPPLPQRGGDWDTNSHSSSPSLEERGLGGEAAGEAAEASVLFLRLTSLLRDDRLFTRSDIDRRSLADRLGTNEKYLSNAIRESGWESLPGYLSHLRLGYALSLLDSEPTKPLDTIASESGHGSYTSFYRAFSREYGLTPSEYRKIQLGGVR